MLESPVLQRLLAEEKAKWSHESIVTFLEARFGTVPPELVAALQGVADQQQLKELTAWAAQCPSRQAFASRLPDAG